MSKKPEEPPDGFGDDDEYRPAPSALRISAAVIRRRAAQPGLDARVAADLLDYAMDCWELAARIDGRRPVCSLEPAPASSAAEVFLATEALTGLVESARLPAIDAQIKTFRFVVGARPEVSIASAGLIQHANGLWEVLHVEVAPARRRKGAATILYNCIEEFLNTKLHPSGWLSEDAYAFWRRRNAESVAGYRRVEPFLDLWISPGQLLNLLTIDRIKIEAWMKSAAADAALRLH
jgi:hypothetical protein